MNRSAIAWPRSVGGRGALPAAPGTSRRHLDLAAHIYHLRFWPIYICLILHDPLKGAPVAIRSSPRLFTPAPTTKPVHAGGFQTTDGTVEASTWAPGATPLRWGWVWTPQTIYVTLTARNSIVHHQLAGCRHTSGTERRRTWNQQASNHIKQHEHKPLLETISSKNGTTQPRHDHACRHCRPDHGWNVLLPHQTWDAESLSSVLHRHMPQAEKSDDIFHGSRYYLQRFSTVFPAVADCWQQYFCFGTVSRTTTTTVTNSCERRGREQATTPNTVGILGQQRHFTPATHHTKSSLTIRYEP